jgi:hypothetical protein
VFARGLSVLGKEARMSIVTIIIIIILVLLAIWLARRVI